MSWQSKVSWCCMQISNGPRLVELLEVEERTRGDGEGKMWKGRHREVSRPQPWSGPLGRGQQAALMGKTWRQVGERGSHWAFFFFSPAADNCGIYCRLSPRERMLSSCLPCEVDSPVKLGMGNISLENKIFSREKKDFPSSPNSSLHIAGGKLC